MSHLGINDAIAHGNSVDIDKITEQLSEIERSEINIRRAHKSIDFKDNESQDKVFKFYYVSIIELVQKQIVRNFQSINGIQ